MNIDPRHAIIFDRDGTLLDFSEMFYQFILQLYRRESLTPPDRETILSLQFWLDITRNNLMIGQTVVKDYVDDVPRKYIHFGRAYPGVCESLIKLRQQGINMAIVSGWVGTESTKAWLGTIGLASSFCCILTADDLQENRLDYLNSGYLDIKTSLFQAALTKLGVPASEAWIVGDSPEDIAAANTLGTHTIAVLTGNGQRMLDQIKKLKPHFIIDSVALVHQLLANPAHGQIAVRGVNHQVEELK